MKKLIARTALMAALTVASLGSYLYLNSISTDVQPERTKQVNTPLKNGQLEEEEVRLPGVTLVKTVFHLGKRFVTNY